MEINRSLGIPIEPLAGAIRKRRIAHPRALDPPPARLGRRAQAHLLGAAEEALELCVDGRIEGLVVGVGRAGIAAAERPVVLDDIVLFQVAQGEGARGGVRRGADRGEEEAGGYFGREVDGGGAGEEGGERDFVG